MEALEDMWCAYKHGLIIESCLNQNGWVVDGSMIILLIFWSFHECLFFSRALSDKFFVLL